MGAKAAPDGYTLIGGGSGPVAANLDALQDARLRPAEGPRDDLAVRGLHHRRRRQQEPAGQVAQGTDRATPRPIPASSTTARSASAVRSIWPASISARSPARRSTHVPYRNIAQYGPDLIAGTVPLGFQWYPNVAGAIGTGGAIPLAVAGDKRIPALPDTPTTTEAGPAGIQGQRLVRAAGARRHAEADPGEAQQGTDRGAERSRRASRASRRPAPRPSRCRSIRRRSFTPTRSRSTATSSPRPAFRKIE